MNNSYNKINQLHKEGIIKGYFSVDYFETIAKFIEFINFVESKEIEDTLLNEFVTSKEDWFKKFEFAMETQGFEFEEVYTGDYLADIKNVFFYLLRESRKEILNKYSD